MDSSMDSSKERMWAAKVDQSELKEVIKSTAIKFLDALLLSARIQSLVRRLILDPICRTCSLTEGSTKPEKRAMRGHASSRA